MSVQSMFDLITQAFSLTQMSGLKATIAQDRGWLKQVYFIRGLLKG
jgi:hypothetical protein